MGSSPNNSGVAPEIEPTMRAGGSFSAFATPSSIGSVGVVILADGANLQGDILKSLTKEEREAALKACATARDELIKQATKDLAACIKKHGNQEGNSNYEGCKKDYKDSNEQAWAAYRANEELYKQK